MLSPYNFFAFMSQLPLAEAGQLLLVAGIAFAIITLIASMHRFNKIIEVGGETLVTVEDVNDFFFIHVTRYLSRINRTSTGFGIATIQFQTEETNLRTVQEALLSSLNNLLREECDQACLFREDCVGLIIDTDVEKVTQAVERVVAELSEKISDIPAITALRTGISAFPLHEQSSQALIDAATEAMEQASFGSSDSVHIASLAEEQEDEEEESDEIGELRKQDKNSAIDRLTGVLKPEAIGSYMRKYLSEIRYKKNPASVLCVGINRIDHIIHLHGEAGGDTVIAGVSEVLQRLTRHSDLIGRYHRDDFIILAPCSLEQGRLIATRLREAIQKEAFLFEGRNIKTSISVGISAHPEHGRTMRILFDGAYAALSVIRGWNTSSCLVYDPARHNKKDIHEPVSQTRG